MMAMMAAAWMRVRRTGRKNSGNTTVTMAMAHRADHELHRLQSDREHRDDELKAGRHLRDLNYTNGVQDGRIMPKVLACVKCN